MWDTVAQREQILAENRAEYAALEAAFADWAESRHEVGVFRVQAEATVRPRGRTQREVGEVGRSSRRTIR